MDSQQAIQKTIHHSDPDTGGTTLGCVTAKKAASLVHDLMHQDRRRYFIDFLCSVTVGYLAALIYLYGEPFTVLSLTAFVIAGVALYRSASFMHEVVHLRSWRMKNFKLVWNLVAGIPMLMPSFFYESHLDHHKTHHYGTEHDGEYLPLGHASLTLLVSFFLQVLYLPIFTFLRFLLLTPVSFIMPSSREPILSRTSSFVIDLHYRRQLPPRGERSRAQWREWAFMDLACSLVTWGLTLSILMGFQPWFRIIQLYSLAVFILSMNYLRTLVAHHYRNEDRSRMSQEQQLLDSTNVEGGWLVGIVFPVGLRYHALHHMLPSLPYHNLASAHRRLVQHLPPDSPYHRTIYPNFWALVWEKLWHCLQRSFRPSIQAAP